MKNTLCILFIIFSSLFIQAQNENYKEAFIITNNHDTITGYADYRTDEINAKYCSFKESIESTPKVLNPENINGYYFINENKYYISREIEIDNEKRKVFLEYLVKGIMNLYHYSLNNQSYFFFENENGEMTRVTKAEDEEIGNRIVKDNKYKGIITYLFKDYPSISNETKNIRFSQKDFIKVTKKYHNEICTTGEECIVFENKKPDRTGLKCNFSVYTGMQQLIFTFSQYEKEFTSKDLSPLVGAQINLFNPRWSKSFSAQAGLSFSSHSGTTKKTTLSGTASDFTKCYYHYKASTLSIRLGGKYVYPKYKIRPRIEGGFTYTSLLNTSATIYIHPHNRNYSLMKSYYGCYLGAGVEYSTYKEQALFLSFVWEDYIRNTKGYVYNDYLKTPHIKLGYTF